MELLGSFNPETAFYPSKRTCLLNFARNRFAPVPLQNVMLLSISIEKLFLVKYIFFFPILPFFLYSFGKPDTSAQAGANLD